MSMITNHLGSEIYSEAATYLGNRRALRKEVEMCPDRISLLEAQTDLMTQVSQYKGMLWSVELRNTSAKIYLFAVSHSSLQIKVNINEFIHPIVREKLAGSERLYVELREGDIPLNVCGNINVAQLLQAIEERTNHQERSLSEFIGQTKFTATGLDRALERLATYYCIETYSLELIYDQINYLLARSDIIKQADLDPVNERTMYFDREMAIDAIDAIQSGNFEQMCDLARDQLPEINTLLQKRNPAMVSQMIRTLEASTPAFFAIGATHFVGTEGILALLSKDEKVHISRIQLP